MSDECTSIRVVRHSYTSVLVYSRADTLTSVPSLSIVIPTHRRAAILEACLEHLERQTIADQLEVIVVSDGHDPATAALFKEPRSANLAALSFVEIPKSQQGRARNVGVAQATGETVLFINDDILLAPGACEAHLKAHAGHTRIAALGYTEWDPSVGITPVMRWLDKTGWQFGYRFLDALGDPTVPAAIQHRFTYASHVSVPREVAVTCPFPEDLTDYGWEDTVWGMMLRDKGVPLHYLPAARALHRHRLDLAQSLDRMRRIGRSAVILQERYPAFDGLPSGKKLLVYRLVSLLPTLRGKHAKALLEGIGSN